MFALFKEKKQVRDIAALLYETVMHRTREPAFYEMYGVPDTIDGRFDVICIHIFLVMDRLYKEGVWGKRVAQALFDCMFREMDAILREMGVGDLGIPKHVKRMMKGFNGRAAVYKEAIESDNPYELVEALLRNLYGTVDKPCEERARYVASYMTENASYLAEQSAETVLQGQIKFRGIGNDEGKNETDDVTRMVA